MFDYNTKYYYRIKQAFMQIYLLHTYCKVDL